MNFNAWVDRLDQVRVNYGVLVPHELTALMEFLREVSFGNLFKLGSVFCAHGVPKLWFTVVKIVDGRQIKVFAVPGKGGPPSTKVEIRYIDA